MDNIIKSLQSYLCLFNNKSLYNINKEKKHALPPVISNKNLKLNLHKPEAKPPRPYTSLAFVFAGIHVLVSKEASKIACAAPSRFPLHAARHFPLHTVPPRFSQLPLSPIFYIILEQMHKGRKAILMVQANYSNPQGLSYLRYGLGVLLIPFDLCSFD